MDGKSKLEMMLRPVRRRMMRLRLVRTSAFGMLAGSLAAILLLTASRLFPLPYGQWLAVCMVAIGLGAGLLYGILRQQVTVRDAALMMDRQVTSDALVTALGNQASHHPVARLQREDAEQAASRYVERLKEYAPGPGRQIALRFGGLLALLWVGAAVLVFVPNPMDDRIAAKAAADRELVKLEEKAAELAEQVEKLDPNSANGQKLEQTLDALRDRMKELKHPETAVREIEAMQRDLERLADDMSKQEAELGALAEQMQSSRELRALGQALEKMDSSAMNQAMKDLRSQVLQMNPKDRAALAEKLRELAEDRVGAEEAEKPEQSAALKKALEAAAETVESMDKTGGETKEEEALDGLEQALTEGLSAAQLESLARQMAGQLGQAAATLGNPSGGGASGGMNSGWSPDKSGSNNGWSGESGSGAAAGSESGGQGGQNNGSTSGDGSGTSGEGNSGQGAGQSSDQGSGQGSSQGAGAGQGNGAGQGAGSGTGSGQGSGSGQGAGSGTGSSQGSGTGSGSGGTGSGTGGGTGGLAGGHGNGGRDLVTTPRSLGGSGNVQQDGGPSQGGQVSEDGSSPVLDGGAQSYEEVYSSYAAEARQSLNRSLLPPSMQQRVRDYFDEIQPNR